MAFFNIPFRAYLRRAFLLPLFAFSMLLTPNLHAAEPSADSVVKFRKALMGEIKSSLQSLFLLLKQEVDDDKSIALQAQILALSSQRVGASFVYRTRGVAEETTAHERVWTEAKDFQAQMQKFAKDTQAFAELVASSEANADAHAAMRKTLAKSLAGIGKQCKSCHDRYRTE